MGRALLVSSILEIFILAAARMRQVAGSWISTWDAVGPRGAIARKVKTLQAKPFILHLDLGLAQPIRSAG